MPTRDDHVAAARQLLREACELLATHRDDAVLIGGWVPGLLFPDAEPSHPGSMDVDVVLRLNREAYARVVAMLQNNGFHQRENGYEFTKEVPFGGGRKAFAKLDLLTSHLHHERYFAGTSQKNAPQAILGADIAFRNNSEGDLPIRVAGIVAFIVMKSIALGSRTEPKDAFDIIFCLESYPGGLSALASEFASFADDSLVRDGLEKLRRKFNSEDDEGPRMVVDREGLHGEVRAIRRRDAHALVDEFLGLVGQGKEP